MKIGIAIWNIRSEKITEKIERLITYGFNSVSFLGSSVEKEKEADIAKIIKENNLTLTFHLGFFGVNSEKIIEELDIRLDSIFKFLEGNKIRGNAWSICFDPAFIGEKSKEEMKFDLANTAKALKHTIKRANGIKVGIENWLINSRIEDFIKLKETVCDERLGMLLDFGHLNIALRKKIIEEETIPEYLSKLPFEIIEIHVHDNNGQEDNHYPIGLGNADMDLMFDSLKNCGKWNKDGVITLEISPNLKGFSIDDKTIMAEVVKNKEYILKKMINE